MKRPKTTRKFYVEYRGSQHWCRLTAHPYRSLAKAKAQAQCILGKSRVMETVLTEKVHKV